MLGIMVQLPESELLEFPAVLQRYLGLREKETFTRTGQNNSLPCILSLLRAYFQLGFADVTDQHFKCRCFWALHCCTHSGCFCSVLETKCKLPFSLL